MKPEIHFAHANGFPAATYRKFFSYLSRDYTVSYIDLLAHDPAYPVSENWQHLTDQLIHHLLRHYRQPIIGVGHSLGGGLTYMAALQRPELFKAIILLDYPLLGKLKSCLLRWSKKLGFIDYITPARSTRGRRALWPDIASAWKYLHHHPLFRYFDEECLWDYIHYGTEHTPRGLRLKFSPAIEYQIFRTFPHHFPQLPLQHHVPAALIYGKKTTVLTAWDRRIIARQYHLPLYGAPGSHLLPFEYPQAVAQAVRHVSEILLQKSLGGTRTLC